MCIPENRNPHFNPQPLEGETEEQMWQRIVKEHEDDVRAAEYEAAPAPSPPWV